MSNNTSRRMSRQVPSASTPRSKPARKAPSGMAIGVGVGIVAAIALALAIAIGVGASSGDSSTSIEQVGFAETIGTGLPLHNASLPNDPAVGTDVPRITGSDFSDARIDVNPGDGKGKVIGFFAHWCPHCQRELPLLTDWLDTVGAPDDVDVVAVSTAVKRGESNYPPSAWFDEVGWPAPVIRDTEDSAVATSYGLAGFPYFVAVGPDGKVLARASGELDVAQWEALIDLAAGGRQ